MRLVAPLGIPTSKPYCVISRISICNVFVAAGDFRSCWRVWSIKRAYRGLLGTPDIQRASFFVLVILALVRLDLSRVSELLWQRRLCCLAWRRLSRNRSCSMLNSGPQPHPAKKRSRCSMSCTQTRSTRWCTRLGVTRMAI